MAVGKETREQNPLAPGDKFGDCVIVKPIGRGGSGVVYLAKAPDGGDFALKIVTLPHGGGDAQSRKRFVREAVFAMNIRHKNLIQVHDAGEDSERGLCYILMDYLPGGSVKDRLEAHGAMPITEAVSIASHVAAALEVAHRRGVIHRDIKPANILFDAAGTPKLADLGVAKFIDESGVSTETTPGMIVGTPAYMAPEQMLDSRHIDARADIYSLGVVLYEMLTNRRPNSADTVMGMIAKAIKGEVLPDVRSMRPEVSASVAYVLSLMCAPKPEDRPRTSGAVADLLVRADSDLLLTPPCDPSEGKSPPPVAAPVQPCSRSSLIAAIVVLSIALLAALLFAILK